MPNNNGNLKRQEVYIPDDDAVSSYHLFPEEFEYDSVNRLQRVADNLGTPTWQQKYVYDQFGNRTIAQGVNDTFGNGIPKPNFTVNTSNNRLGVPSGQSGTMTSDLSAAAL